VAIEPYRVTVSDVMRGAYSKFDPIVGAPANRRRVLDQPLCERLAHRPANADFNEVVEYEALIARNRSSSPIVGRWEQTAPATC